jgi:hypothetical protein
LLTSKPKVTLTTTCLRPYAAVGLLLESGRDLSLLGLVGTVSNLRDVFVILYGFRVS